MKRRLANSMLVALMALGSAMAFAEQHATGPHIHTQLFHDRSPKPHSHAAQPHKTNVQTVSPDSRH